MQVVRVHDPSRRPASWTEIIESGQFAVFSKDDVLGVPCDLEGLRFAHADDVTCVVAGSIDEARQLSERAVERHPSLRCDVFDADGRTRPPLLTVVHPARAKTLETSTRQTWIRSVSAWTLIVLSVPLLVYAWLLFDSRERDVILPTFFGINMVLVALRLLWMNLLLRETEGARERRLRQLER
jgi:hypothetical protein